MTRLVISSGHGKYIRGASGSPVPPQLDEVDEARKIVETVATDLRLLGVEVVTYHDDVSDDSSENLNRIVDFHNGQGPHDYDVSIHLNAFDGIAHGCEVLWVTQEALAEKISAAISAASQLKNRGSVYRDDLFFLANTAAKAVLIEVCFCDNTSDCTLYREHYAAICRAIAETLSGGEIDLPDRPDRPERPPPDRPDRPPPELPERPPPDMPLPRPTLEQGDTGPAVSYMQSMLPHAFDGDFGPITDGELREYQRTRGLPVTGICDDETWAALESNSPPVMPAMPSSSIAAIMLLASISEVASFNWADRGVAPLAYTQGMALSFAQSYLRLKARHPAVLEMAQGNTHDDDVDALSWFQSDYEELGISNEVPGANVLTSLYMLLLGLGMRESSGRFCCGRDQSADNTSSETCEAGLFQTSYNSHVCSPMFDVVMDEFEAGETVAGFSQVFAQDVTCSDADWDNYGSGRGEQFQALCKASPAFAVESCALVLRGLRQHYGPVNRREVQILEISRRLFRAVRAYVDRTAPEDV